MKKQVTARHFDLTPEMKAKAEEEMEGLTRFFDSIVSAEMVLDAERHRRVAELKVNVFNNLIAGRGETDDMYAAIDVAVDKVKTQLKKYKGKLKDRKPEEVAGVKASLSRPKTDVDEVDM